MFKLHKAIPYRVFTPKPAVKSEAKKAPKEQIQEEEVPEIETQHEYVSMFSRSKVLAGTAKLRWMAREMDQATAHPDMTHKEAYRQYVIACQQMEMHMRTEISFTKKRRQLLKS